MYKQYFNPDTNCDEQMGVQLTIEVGATFNTVFITPPSCPRLPCANSWLLALTGEGWPLVDVHQ
jgi:hypothetical protein